MARNRKRKALYEVMSKTRHKSSYGKILERLHQKKGDKTEPTTDKADTAMPQDAAQWRRRPKLIQFNNSRIEISIPYQLAIALLLGLILLILVAFRLGQINQKAANSPAKMQKTSQISLAEHDTADTKQAPASSEALSPSQGKIRPAELPGDHVIILVQYMRRADLVPVKEHFAQYGIQTEIVQEGGWYFLVTKDRYQNPENQGTDGYQAKQRIIEVGAQYKGKAPEGYETFAPHFFRDAYGKKVR